MLFLVLWSTDRRTRDPPGDSMCVWRLQNGFKANFRIKTSDFDFISKIKGENIDVVDDIVNVAVYFWWWILRGYCWGADWAINFLVKWKPRWEDFEEKSSKMLVGFDGFRGDWIKEETESFSMKFDRFF